MINNPGNVAPSFESAEQAINFGAITTVAHGLGAIPKRVSVTLRCKIAESGWNIGDEIEYSFSYFDGLNSTGCLVSCDAVNINVQEAANGIIIFNKVTQLRIGITPINWRAVLRAYL